MTTTSTEYISQAEKQLRTLTDQLHQLDSELTRTRLTAHSRQRLTELHQSMADSAVEVQRQLIAAQRTSPKAEKIPVLDLVCR